MSKQISTIVLPNRNHVRYRPHDLCIWIHVTYKCVRHVDIPTMKTVTGHPWPLYASKSYTMDNFFTLQYRRTSMLDQDG